MRSLHLHPEDSGERRFFTIQVVEAIRLYQCHGGRLSVSLELCVSCKPVGERPQCCGVFGRLLLIECTYRSGSGLAGGLVRWLGGHDSAHRSSPGRRWLACRSSSALMGSAPSVELAPTRAGQSRRARRNGTHGNKRYDLAAARLCEECNSHGW